MDLTDKVSFEELDWSLKDEDPDEFFKKNLRPNLNEEDSLNLSDIPPRDKEAEK